MKRTLYYLLQAIILVSMSAQLAWGAHMKATTSSLQTIPFHRTDVPCLLMFQTFGDSKRGPLTELFKALPGCVIPWHQHTSGEQVIVMTGQISAQMADGKTNLKKGWLANMPGGMKHQLICQSRSACFLLVTWDKPYDICWYDKCPDPSATCTICK